MEETAYCTICQAVVPIGRQAAGKAIGGALGTMVGGVGTKSLAGAIALGAIGLVLGHLLDEVFDGVCGHCGGPLRALPAT